MCAEKNYALGTKEYYKEYSERLEKALYGACEQIHILNGGMSKESAYYEYNYFRKLYKLNEIDKNGNLKYFAEGELVYANIPADCLDEFTPKKYVGEIVRVETGEDFYCISFNRETQKIARAESGLKLRTPIATIIPRSKIWGAEGDYVMRTANDWGQRVKVVQFQSPYWAIIRYPSGDIMRVKAEYLEIM